MSMGLNMEEHDQEGRVITAEYPGFYGMHAPLSATFLVVKLSPLEYECERLASVVIAL